MKVRRKFTRVPFKLESTLTVDQICFEIIIIDISLKGALVTKPREWISGKTQEILMEMKLLNPEIVIRMQTEVAHEHEDKLGLRFVEVDMESLSHLRRLMELNLGDAELINKEVSNLY